MVAWNLAKDQVDEFWRISEMKNTPWGRPKGVDNGLARVDFSPSHSPSLPD
jgi:hypothetical protein